VKKPTKFRARRQLRSRRCSRKGRSSLQEVFSLRGQLREALVAEIRGAVAATARQLVEDEVLSLVGEPWSRKGDSPLRRNGSTTSSIYLQPGPASPVARVDPARGLRRQPALRLGPPGLASGQAAFTPFHLSLTPK
jgi:hypothetical protein